MNDSRIAPVFQILAEDIHALGVRTVFRAHERRTRRSSRSRSTGSGVKFVGARHENNAIAMAEGYCLRHRRAGRGRHRSWAATANGLHAAVAASRMGSRVLVIYGDAAVGAAPSTASAPTTRVSTRRPSWGPRDSPASRPPARRPRARPWQTLWPPPVLERWRRLLLPHQRPEANVEVWGPAAARSSRPARPAAARQQSIDSAAALLSKIGGSRHRGWPRRSSSGGEEALQTLAEKIGALLMTSAAARTCSTAIRTTWAFWGRSPHDGAGALMDQADCVLVFGAGLNFLTMSFGGLRALRFPIIQVDTVRATSGGGPRRTWRCGRRRRVARAAAGRAARRRSSGSPFTPPRAWPPSPASTSPGTSRRRTPPAPWIPGR